MIKGTVVQVSRSTRQKFVKLDAPLEIVPIYRRYDEDHDPVVVDVVCASREIVSSKVAVFPAIKRGVGKNAGYVIRSWAEIGYGADHKSALADCGIEIE